MRRRYSRDQWSTWINEQRTSGLSIAAFCQSAGLTENTFYRWRSRLADATDASRSHVSATFIPLETVVASNVEIDFACGARVRVPSNEMTIRTVLGVLLDADCSGATC